MTGVGAVDIGRMEWLVLLLTDIEGSTPLWDRSPAVMEAALPRHDQIMQEVVEAHGGDLVRSKGEGDSTFSVFPSEAAAARAAVDAQRRLAAEHWPGGVTLAVRMSVHAGEALARDGTWFGTTVNRAARLRSLAAGGEVVVSESVANVLATEAAELQLVELGSFVLRGLAQPERVRRIVIDTAPQRPITHHPFPATLQLGQVFVGRTAELAALAERWAAVRHGGTAAVRVVGEAGSGKSRLVAEFAATAHGDGASVVHIVAGSTDDGELAALGAALDGLVARLPGEVVGTIDPGRLARLVPFVPSLAPLTSGARPDRSDPATDRTLLVDTMAELVRALCEVRPMLLVVEDLHDATGGFVELVRALVHEHIDRLLVTTTNRSGEDAALASLGGTQGLGPVVDLQELGEREITELLQLTTGVDASPALVRALLASTGGNPLLLAETVELLAADGWRSLGALPSSIDEVVGARLEGLGPHERRVLEAAAVIGASFPVWLLDQVCGRGGGDVVDAIDTIERHGLVVPVDTASYCFTHALVRAVVLARTDTRARASLHLRIAEMLEVAEPPAAPLLISEHLAASVAAIDDPDQQAKVRLTAAEHALTAGRQLLERFGFTEAAAAIEVGMEMRATRTHTREVDAALAITLSRAKRASGDVDEAQRAAVLATEHALDLGSVPLITDASLELAQHGTIGIVDPDIQRLLRRAATVVTDDHPPERSLVLSALAFHDMLYAQDRASAQLLVREATDLARRSDHDRALANSLSVTGTIELCSPDAVAQLERGRELRAIGLRLGDATIAQRALRIEVCAQLQLARRREFEAAVRRLETLAAQQRSWFWRSLAIQWETMSALMDGRLDAAEQHANQLLMGSAGDVDLVNVYGAQLMLIREAQGRIHEVLPLAAAALDGNPALAAFRVALAAGYAQLGDETESRRHFEALAASEFGGVPDDVSRAGSIALLAQAASVVGTDAECATLDGLLAPFSGQLILLAGGIACLGAADRFRALLAGRQGDWDGALARALAASDLERSIGAAGLVVRSDAVRAEAMIRSGLDAQAGRRLAARTAGQARALGMVGLADQAESLLSPDG